MNGVMSTIKIKILRAMILNGIHGKRHEVSRVICRAAFMAE
jgi:hypothetical protein